MKPILFLSACFILSINVFAQNFSTGVRMGSSLWSAPNGVHAGVLKPIGIHTFDKEIYIQYQFKNRVVIEPSFKFYSLNLDKWYKNFNMLLEDEPVYEILYADNRFSTYEYGLSVQYLINSTYKSRLQHLAGISFSYVDMYAAYNLVLRKIGTPEIEVFSFSKKEGYLYLVGLNYTLRYQATQHININTKASLQLDPGMAFAEHHFYIPNTKLSLTAGIGYTF